MVGSAAAKVEAGSLVRAAHLLSATLPTNTVETPCRCSNCVPPGRRDPGHTVGIASLVAAFP
jgi:hypothetical protein